VDGCRETLATTSPLLACRLAPWLRAYPANTIDDIAMEEIMEKL